MPSSMLPLPGCTSTMSALWEWASNLSSLERRETLQHLSFRWQTSSRALAGSADIFSSYLDKAADLGKAARGKYHELSQYPIFESKMHSNNFDTTVDDVNPALPIIRNMTEFP